MSAVTKDDKAPKGELEDFVVIETDDAGIPVTTNRQAEAAGHDSEDDDADERVGHSEEDEADTGAVAGETPEQKRERRRNENKAKRIRNRVANENRERQLQSQAADIAALTDKVATLEGRTQNHDLSQIRMQLTNIEQQQRDAKTTMAQLSAAQDWDGVAEVTEIQGQLRDQHRQLTAVLQQAQRRGTSSPDDNGEPRRTSERRGPAPIPPEVVVRARTWAESNPWFSSGESPADVEVVKGLDRVLAKTMNPGTDAYWAELTKQARKYLPHRFPTPTTPGVPAGGKPNNQSRGPEMASASQSGRALGKNEVRITPARRKAMEEAGSWDDPVRRKKQLAAYKKYDEEHAA